MAFPSLEVLSSLCLIIEDKLQVALRSVFSSGPIILTTVPFWDMQKVNTVASVNINISLSTEKIK